MGKRPKISYDEKLVCFDIETSKETVQLPDGSDSVITYTWHWQSTVDGEYHTFSSWEDWFTFCDRIRDRTKDRMIVFVHNLSFEMEFIIRNCGDHVVGNVFAVDTHKPLKFTVDDCIEYRCSYQLTNKSLALCGKDVGLEKGDMDYSIVRHPGDELTDQEKEYCMRDVLIMDRKIRQMEKQEGMNFWQFPLTNTGFIRRELRLEMRKERKNRRWFTNSRLSYDQFMLCRDCFWGGYTHANAMYTGEVITGGELTEGIDSYDYGSAYPFAMLAHRFPSGGFHRVDRPTASDLEKMMKRRDVCFMARVYLKGVRARTTHTYISYSKCKTDPSVCLDNGRVYSCALMEIALTDLDYRIIRKAYHIESVAVKELYWSRTDYLPPEYVKTMLEYYIIKSRLKGAKEESQKLNYMKAKNRLNSFYGMAVTSPLHDEILLDETDWKRERKDYTDRALIEDCLNAFYKSYNSFLPYQVGVWVPAWTRFHLWYNFILEDGNDRRTLYCDTDSAKIVDREKCLPAIRRYNDWVGRIKKERLTDLGYGDRLDIFDNLGIFDWETEAGAWTAFKTLGAKCYLYQDKDGFHMTVSGLSKKAVKYIESFDDFEVGTVFGPDVSGRTVSRPTSNEIPTYDRGGVWLEDTTYQLGMSNDYISYTGHTASSDLVITKNGRYHRNDFTIDSKIDLVTILKKRNVYGVTL